MSLISTNYLVNHKFQLLAFFACAALFVVPVNALAFETNLAATAQATLAAPIATISGDSAVSVPSNNAIPDYTYSSSGVALGLSSPVTATGNWETISKKPRIVLASALKPLSGKSIVLEGEASYYSRSGCLGCNPLRIMANGQPLNDNALTMAIGADKGHLVGYRARVTNLKTGLSTIVTITDTGGFYQSKYGNRVADLTIATKEAIGMHGGVGQVRVEVF